MAVYFDDWKIDKNEATVHARRRYNDTRPFTVLQYSSGFQPLAIGGEVAARSGDLLREVGITCRLCVVGSKGTGEPMESSGGVGEGVNPSPILGLRATKIHAPIDV